MRSMTGFGTAEGRVGKGWLFVEVKTINHRFCEVNVKAPPKMGAVETYIKKSLENRYLRGKVDVFVREVRPLLGEAEIKVDTELAKKYQQAFEKLTKELKIKTGQDFFHCVAFDRFVTVREKSGNYGLFLEQIRKILERACAHVDKMRAKEGLFIQKDQKKRLAHIKKLVKSIGKGSDRAMERNEDRVRKRVNKLGNLDEQRLATEVAYIGGRQDIAEEITRLESHLEQYSKLVLSKESVGRKLDFLLQEINREINTIGSKASDAAISRLVVDCKSEIERLREQIQNVE